MLKTDSITTKRWPSTGVRRQAPLQGAGVGVRRHHPPRAGQPQAVDQAGVVERVRIDDIPGLRQRGQHRQVRQVAARKVQAALGALERREAPLDGGKRLAMAPQQARPGAAAAGRRGSGERLHHARVDGQPEIVVGGEVDARGRAQPPQQPPRAEVRQTGAHPVGEWDVHAVRVGLYADAATGSPSACAARVECDHTWSHTFYVGHSERVTITLPGDLVEGIDRLERNRSRFIAGAVQRELARRRREALLQSLGDLSPVDS